jgi:hypothetical protein
MVIRGFSELLGFNRAEIRCDLACPLVSSLRERPRLYI